MITKLKQIWRDHKAMQAIRQHNADVYLVSTVGQDGSGFDVWTCQAMESYIYSADPAKAILDSFATFPKWKDKTTHSILTTFQAKMNDL